MAVKSFKKLGTFLQSQFQYNRTGIPFSFLDFSFFSFLGLLCACWRDPCRLLITSEMKLNIRYTCEQIPSITIGPY